MKSNFYTDDGEIVNDIDDTSISDKTGIVYPHIYLDEWLDDLGTLLITYGNGHLPIYVKDKKTGYKKELPMAVPNTPLELNKLLRVQPIVMVLSKDKSVKIKNIVELLDMEDYIWTQ